MKIFYEYLNNSIKELLKSGFTLIKHTHKANKIDK